jgi:hypothetical protein
VGCFGPGLVTLMHMRYKTCRNPGKQRYLRVSRDGRLSTGESNKTRCGTEERRPHAQPLIHYCTDVNGGNSLGSYSG